MAIKFDKVKPGMVLLDIHREKAGNTTTTRLGCWKVQVVAVNADGTGATVSWNGNTPAFWSRAKIEKLYVREPPSYLKRKAARS